MDHPKVEQSVIVVIEPACGNGPLAASYTRRARDVLKSAVTAIPVKDISIHARDEEVGMPVVVEIRSGSAHRVAFARNARVLGRISELQVAFVVIQTIPIFGAGLMQRRNFGTV